MNADDPRHGTRRGYYAHRKDGEQACAPCKRAAADAEARYAQNRYLGKPGRVPAVGTKRRLQALHALGWTWTALAAELGTSRSAVEKWANEPRAFMYASTATRVTGVYELSRPATQTRARPRGTTGTGTTSTVTRCTSSRRTSPAPDPCRNELRPVTPHRAAGRFVVSRRGVHICTLRPLSTATDDTRPIRKRASDLRI